MYRKATHHLLPNACVGFEAIAGPTESHHLRPRARNVCACTANDHTSPTTPRLPPSTQIARLLFLFFARSQETGRVSGREHHHELH